MQDAEQYLVEVAARLIRLTEEAYPDPRDRHHITEPPGITDDDWVALVAIIFCQLHGLTPSFALNAVNRNRTQIISARRQGLDAEEVVEFVWENFGPPPSSAIEPNYWGPLN